jgi:hypothetical protein
MFALLGLSAHSEDLKSHDCLQGFTAAFGQVNGQ